MTVSVAVPVKVSLKSLLIAVPIIVRLTAVWVAEKSNMSLLGVTLPDGTVPL